jgi:site-specific recombinase XerD
MQTQRHLPSGATKQSSKTVSVRSRIAVTRLRITPRSRPSPTIAQLIAEFDRHMEQVCGFSVSTRRLRRQHGRDLLKWRYGMRRVHLSELSVRDLTKFVTSRVPDLAPGSRHVMTVSLRSFCRFLEFSGRIRVGLSGAVPRVAAPPPAQPPKTLDFNQWQRFLLHFPRVTAIGKRDYAIALCLSKLALRSHEVTALTLDDINWQARTLRLSRTKQRRERLLSMPDQVAKAIANYLKRGRPRTESRALFVHHNLYVGRPISTNCVRDLIRRAFDRCGIAARGTHILRHTWAAYAHRRGASLKLIADILGHGCLQTTLRYAHVNLEELRQAALPWPRIRK